MYERLLAKIKDKQGATSSREFAKMLGISNVQWSAVICGEKRMGRETLQAVAKLYPEFQDDIDIYWMSLINAEAVA